MGETEGCGVIQQQGWKSEWVEVPTMSRESDWVQDNTYLSLMTGDVNMAELLKRRKSACDERQVQEW